MIKWKKHYGIWKGTCNKKPVGTIKSLNTGGYLISHFSNTGSPVKEKWERISLDFARLRVESYYEVITKGEIE